MGWEAILKHGYGDERVRGRETSRSEKVKGLITEGTEVGTGRRREEEKEGNDDE
jgi:hypothetical protein